jgi:hypothetical protein
VASVVLAHAGAGVSARAGAAFRAKTPSIPAVAAVMTATDASSTIRDGKARRLIARQ